MNFSTSCKGIVWRYLRVIDYWMLTLASREHCFESRHFQDFPVKFNSSYLKAFRTSGFSTYLMKILLYFVYTGGFSSYLEANLLGMGLRRASCSSASWTINRRVIPLRLSLPLIILWCFPSGSSVSSFRTKLLEVSMRLGGLASQTLVHDLSPTPLIVCCSFSGRSFEVEEMQKL